MKVEIIWVHDNYDGPYSGMAKILGENQEENSKKFWFRRVGNDYELIEINEYEILFFEQCHKEQCEKTGRPLLHGDPMIIRKKPMTEKTDFTKFNCEEGFETQMRGLSDVITCPRTFESEKIEGTVIATFSQNDFVNFNVPNRILYEC